jgi:hypothetical protein
VEEKLKERFEFEGELSDGSVSKVPSALTADPG